MNKHVIGGLLISSSLLMGGCGQTISSQSVVSPSPIAQVVTQEFDEALGNTADAATAAKGYMDVYKDLFNGKGIRVYLKLSIIPNDLPKWEAGKNIHEARLTAVGATMTINISESNWKSLTKSDQTKLLTDWATGLEKLYRKSGPIVDVMDGTKPLATASKPSVNDDVEITIE